MPNRRASSGESGRGTGSTSHPVRRGAVVVDRSGEQGPAAPAGDPQQLAHGGGVVGHVLEHVGAQHHVEGLVGQLGHGAGVDAQIDVGAEQVGRDVLDVRQGAQPAFECTLRREVQHPVRGGEQVRAALEEQPAHAVPLQ
jgi:hypothetical protein